MRTPEQFREFLSRKLVAQRPAAVTAGEYYAGTQSLQFLDPEIAAAMRGRIKNLNVNYARLCIDVKAQRLAVTAFSTGPGDISDDDLWALWQASSMDEQSALAQTECLITGRAYFLAWVGPDGSPRITAESPLQCAVHRDPLTGAIVGAIKRWIDDDGYSHSLVFTQERVAEYVSRQTLATDPLIRSSGLPQVTEDAQLVRDDPNPLGVVPMVALVNRPRLGYLDGESELTDILPLVDAVAKLATDLMVAAEYSASPRRWVTGLMPDTRVNAEQAAELAQSIKSAWESAYASKMLMAPDPRTQFGTLDVASLDNYEGAIGLLTSQIASLASLPPYYLNLNTANPTSADALRASEARLTALAEQRQSQWSGTYEDVMRLAVLIRDGRTDPRLANLETKWKSAKPATLAQTADAEVKLVAAGIIDRRSALVELGYSPLDIERILATDTIGAIA